ncbi:TetR/AcrR family transcriptional regulator [Thermostaphylospora chromogena]|uniref:DNA-binding transcriptional regulator, AcrR family n=1 Tax=Thermostaphylospora chromogena TaxID=35622 RepID=A0A1H1CKX7_9ACTN|nr:TetR/AcrR family transcriptional regulator [Thermostaphylospora chromogena]SDQ64814.1 DNA-binding transcriptional regulator, AcrR family [Thermostaphylospora chromogena]
MPKINAATVAEHRARQQDALLAAARDLLFDGGYPALTFDALAKRTGLARPTVYSYFRTKDEVVIALCEAELPLVGADIEKALRRAATPRDRIAAYARAQLRAARRRRYRLAHALANAPLPAETRRRIVTLHRELVPSAAPLFTELGHPDPELAATLLQGLINAAVTAMDAGAPPDRVVESTIAAALNGLVDTGGGS